MSDRLSRILKEKPRVLMPEGSERLAVQMMNICIAQMLGRALPEYNVAMLLIEQLRVAPDETLHHFGLHRDRADSRKKEAMWDAVESVRATLGRDSLFALRLFTETQAVFIRSVEGLIGTAFFQSRDAQHLEVSAASGSITHNSTLADLRNAYNGLTDCYISCIDHTISLLPEKPPLRISIERMIIRLLDALAGLFLVESAISAYREDLQAPVHIGDPLGTIAYTYTNRINYHESFSDKMGKPLEYLDYAGRPFVNRTSMVEFYQALIMYLLCLGDHRGASNVIAELEKNNPVGSAGIIATVTEFMAANKRPE